MWKKVSKKGIQAIHKSNNVSKLNYSTRMRHGMHVIQICSSLNYGENA